MRNHCVLGAIPCDEIEKESGLKGVLEHVIPSLISDVNIPLGVLSYYMDLWLNGKGRKKRPCV